MTAPTWRSCGPGLCRRILMPGSRCAMPIRRSPCCHALAFNVGSFAAPVVRSLRPPGIPSEGWPTLVGGPDHYARLSAAKHLREFLLAGRPVSHNGENEKRFFTLGYAISLDLTKTWWRDP